MAKKDKGSWIGGFFMMAVGFVLWHGLEGFWWGFGAVVAFLSGLASLPPMVSFPQKDCDDSDYSGVNLALWIMVVGVLYVVSGL